MDRGQSNANCFLLSGSFVRQRFIRKLEFLIAFHNSNNSWVHISRIWSHRRYGKNPFITRWSMSGRRRNSVPFFSRSILDATRLICRHARKITMHKAVHHNINEFNIEILSESFFLLRFRFIGFRQGVTVVPYSGSSMWRRRMMVRLNLFSHFVGACRCGIFIPNIHIITIIITYRMNCVSETDRGEERCRGENVGRNCGNRFWSRRFSSQQQRHSTYYAPMACSWTVARAPHMAGI